MKKTYLLFLSVMLFVGGLQTTSAQHTCGTHPPTEAQKIAYLATINKASKSSNRSVAVTNGITYIPIRVNIVTKDNGDGGLPLSDLNEGLSQLNESFLPANIQFYFAGTSHNYIKSSKYYDFISDTSNINRDGLGLLAGINHNAINIYFVNTIKDDYWNQMSGGFTNLPTPNTPETRFNSVFLINDVVLKGSWSHEFGHYFNLMHTHEDANNTTISKRELVTRGVGANCSTTGDQICDTPADPFGLQGKTLEFVNKCTYNGDLTDANGAKFTPMLKNFMSYTYYNCQPNVFTPGQYDRIKTGLAMRLSYATQAGGYYILGFPATVLTAPSKVLTANKVVSWTDNSTTETGFIIERSNSSTSAFSPIGGVAPNVTSFLDSSAADNVVYYYRVRASNATNYSLYSIKLPDQGYTIHVKKQGTTEVPKTHIWSKDTGTDVALFGWDFSPTMTAEADGWAYYNVTNKSNIGCLFKYANKNPTADFKYFMYETYNGFPIKIKNNIYISLDSNGVLISKTITPPVTLTADVAPINGKYTAGKTVKVVLTTPSDVETILYTTDGSNPNPDIPNPGIKTYVFGTPIEVRTTGKIRTLAINHAKSETLKSPETSLNLVFETPILNTNVKFIEDKQPIFPATCYTSGQAIAITLEKITSCSGCTIFYTIDGSDPKTNTSRLTYVTPITITKNTTVRAIEYVGANGSYTKEASKTYCFNTLNTSIKLYVKTAGIPVSSLPKIHVWKVLNNQNTPITNTTNWPTNLPTVVPSGDYAGYSVYEVPLSNVTLGCLFRFGTLQTADQLNITQSTWFEFSTTGALISRKTTPPTSARSSEDTSIIAIVAPIPAKDFINVSYPFLGTKTLDLFILNSNGALVYSKKANYTDGLNETINLANINMANGLYVLKIVDDTTISTTKFLITN